MFQALAELSPDDPNFGGKASGLARLAQSGVPIPEGFAVRAGRKLFPRWSKAQKEEFETRVQALLQRAPIAIRSSALGEDSLEKSFAGLLESVLEISTLEEAKQAVDHCIRSGASERVLDYAQSKKALEVGLVVQNMVDARCAGVLFTREPSGLDPGALVEAVEGLGESLVSGASNPESWRVFQNGLGQTEIQGSGKLLHLDELLSMVTQAWELAHSWDLDLDMEWAIDQGGQLCWLQARPITTGHSWTQPQVEYGARSPQEPPIVVWSDFNIRESLPEAVPLFTWEIWKANLSPFITRSLAGIPEGHKAHDQALVLDRVNGRICFNMNALLGGLAGPKIPELMGLLDEEVSQQLIGLRDSALLFPRHLPGGPLSRLKAATDCGLSTLRLSPLLFQPIKALRTLLELGEQLSQRPPLESLTHQELLTELRLLSSPEAKAIRDGINLASFGALILGIAERLFHKWPKAQGLLAAGIPNNPTTAMSIAIDRMAEVPEGPERDQLLQEFLKRFGHRAPGEMDLCKARWQEEPELVRQLVRSRPPQVESVEQRLSRLSKERQESIESAIAQSPPWRRPLMRFFADAVTLWMPLREAPKDASLRALFRARQAGLEIGRRWTESGWLKQVTDIYHLKFEELVSPEEGLAERIALRKSEFEDFQRMRFPGILRSDGIPVPRPPSKGLCGLGIGEGQVKGPVKKLLTPDPEKLSEGDILVVRFADPAWTPLFPRVAAIIMEVGGRMCHAAVVARELGIPGVFGVRDALEQLEDGEVVTVDATFGLILKESSE